MQVHTYYGVASPPFVTLKEPSGVCVGRGVFLISGAVILSLHFSRAQILPLALSLECPGEYKA